MAVLSCVVIARWNMAKLSFQIDENPNGINGGNPSSHKEVENMSVAEELNWPRIMTESLFFLSTCSLANFLNDTDLRLHMAVLSFVVIGQWNIAKLSLQIDEGNHSSYEEVENMFEFTDSLP